MRKIPMILSIALTSACSQPPNWEGSLEALLTSQPDRFGTVMQNPEKYRVQVMYTQINRDAANKPSFSTYTYHVDPSMYFYPASTVKLPTVALALEKINRLKLLGIDRDTTMLTGSDADYQIPVIADLSSATGLPSVAHYIRKILLVSDNDAFNRLYEFVGQLEINQSLRQKEYLDTRIVHRLETALSKSQNQWTNPVRFLNGDEVVHTQQAQRNQINFYGTRKELLGVAEMVNGERLERPKDFSEKNAYSLMDQHSVIKNLMFPMAVPEKRRFNLNEDDYRFMYRYMSMYPGESGIEDYSDKAKYPPGYVKFLMFGGDAKSIPDHIRVFNKVGDAYGFLTDAAYIVDFKNKVEFLLSATIYTNENQTFNDNEYEYDEIALPFLSNLGQVIYEVELNRPREFKPDLSRFQFTERDQ
jgi:hypothetical protein